MPTLTQAQFAALASPLRHRLECQARRTVHDDAEDVVGDVFLEALEYLHVFVTESTEHAVYAWLLHLLRQRIRDWQRARHPAEPLTEAALCQAMRQMEADDEEALRRAERLGEAKRRMALAPLTERQRDCLVAYLRGERQQVTAARLGTSVGVVSKLAGVAKMKLRAVPQELVASADLDGHAWRTGTRVTIYRRPKRTGAGLADARLREMALAEGRAWASVQGRVRRREMRRAA